MNSFKELENNQVKLFAEARHKRVYDRVHGSLGSLRFLSSIIEMYVPVMADTMVSLSGGGPISTPDSTEKADGQSDDSDQQVGRPPSGPALLDGDEADIPRIS